MSAMQPEQQTTPAHDDLFSDDNNMHPSLPGSGTNTGQTFGALSRKLITSIKNIEAMNVDPGFPNLPKYVVVGDQLAGKSSVVDALCGILLAPGTDAHTRCPVKITTSPSDNPYRCD